MLSDASTTSRCTQGTGLNAPSGAQCFPTLLSKTLLVVLTYVSQCTFWCSVLSDHGPIGTIRVPLLGLNAPSGAQCFPTQCGRLAPASGRSLNAPSGAQCFSTGDDVHPEVAGVVWSQCTFWRSVLSDTSMMIAYAARLTSLNAPSGAQCFPTATRSQLPPNLRLNAPSGAQCFPTWLEGSWWRDTDLSRLNAPSGAQCFPTNCTGSRCMRGSRLNAPSGAQCFPTDRGPKVRTSAESFNAPSGAQCFPTRQMGGRVAK